METVVGRDQELRILKKIEESGAAERVAVYGRRRVGKTYLIRNGFNEAPDFEFCGLHHASLSQHLESFALALDKKMDGVQLVTPRSWLQAFNMLINYFTPLVKKRRRIIFIDEFPWIHTPRSGFLPAFEHFWNTWASKEKNLVVVIYGSAAAWMIRNVIRNRGGLHKRVSHRIRLLPFTLQEAASFLKSRNYETICLKHVDKIKQVLGIADVYSEVSSWRHRGKKGDEGTQMDLLIDRSNSCINVCEIKFSNNRFKVTKPYAENWNRKLQIFKEKTQTRKTLFLTLITAFGISNRDQYPGLLQRELTLDFHCQ